MPEIESNLFQFLQPNPKITELLGREPCFGPSSLLARERSRSLAGVRAANALWTGANTRPNRAFSDSLRREFDAECRALDFADREDAARRIDDWIDQRTDGKVRGLVEPSAIEPGTEIMLTNVVTFRAAWRDPFPRATPGMFRRDDGVEVEVTMMHLVSSLRAVETEDALLVELPYRDSQEVLTLVMPARDRRLSALLEGLSADRLDAWTASLRPRRVAVDLPQLHLSWRSDLSVPLKEMGLVTAFTPSADFSAIDPTRPLRLSSLLHQAALAIDQSGTEAASATAVGVRTLSGQRPASRFRADRPFLFLIRDSADRRIEFIGLVFDPR
jgi:serpin B